MTTLSSIFGKKPSTGSHTPVWFNVNANTTMRAQCGYFVDTLSNVVTMTCPPNAVVGDWVSVRALKYSHSLWIDGNGRSIEGNNTPLQVASGYMGYTLTYSGMVKGWVVTADKIASYPEAALDDGFIYTLG